MDWLTNSSQRLWEFVTSNPIDLAVALCSVVGDAEHLAIIQTGLSTF